MSFLFYALWSSRSPLRFAFRFFNAVLRLLRQLYLFSSERNAQSSGLGNLPPLRREYPRFLEENKILTTAEKSPFPPHLRKDLEPCDPSTDRCRVLTLLDGSPLPKSGEHRTKNSNGQQKSYEVLSIYHRSMRDKSKQLDSIYQHMTCLSYSQIPFPMADTIATDPNFYSELFCHNCKKHFPVEEFRWHITGLPINA